LLIPFLRAATPFLDPRAGIVAGCCSGSLPPYRIAESDTLDFGGAPARGLPTAAGARPSSRLPRRSRRGAPAGRAAPG